MSPTTKLYEFYFGQSKNPEHSEDSCWHWRQLVLAGGTPLGRVAVAASHLDAVIEQFLADAITHDPQVGVIVVKGMAFERKLDMLVAILAVRLPESEDRAELQPLLEEAKKFMQRRNEYLHGLWQLDADAKLEVLNRVRKTGAFKVISVSADDLNGVADRIEIVAAEIEDAYLDMLVDIGVYVPQSPGVWTRVPAHRPHGIVLDETGASGLLVDFRNVEG